jgi:hypothetical protein
MKKIILTSVLLGALAFQPSFAQNKPQAIIAIEAAPGKLQAMEGVQFQGKFKSIDPVSRKVVVVGPKGREFETILGEDVKKFDNIKVGDILNISIMKVIVSDVKVVNTGIKERYETVNYSKVQDSDKPAGIIEHQVKIVADVIAIDKKNNIATFKGPTKTVQLAVGPEIIKGLKKGQQIEALITENIAIQVLAPPTK